MRKLLIVLTLALITGASISGQTPSSAPTATTPPATDAGVTPNGAIGEVTAIDAAAKRLTIKTDAGSMLTVTFDDKTLYKRLAPGEKTLANATDIVLTDISIGDRVFARGKVADDRKSVPARMVILMTKADIAKKQEHDRAEWQQRGLVGVISALNAETKEITLTLRGRGPAAQQQIIINAAAPNVTFRRYAPDSIKFSDANASSFAELKVGDQLRALGEKSADSTRFTPEEIVSGSFKTIGGPILAVNAEANEVKINDLVTKQPFTISIRQDSVVRRLPPEMAAMMAARMGGGAPGANGPGAGSAQGSNRQPAVGGQGSGRPDGAGGPGGQGGGGRRGGGVDFQEVLDRLPQVTLSELKAGDMIIVSSTAGATQGRVTAIAVVAGVEPLLNAMQARQSASAGATGPQAAPNTGINFGIGLP